MSLIRISADLCNSSREAQMPVSLGPGRVVLTGGDSVRIGETAPPISQ